MRSAFIICSTFLIMFSCTSSEVAKEIDYNGYIDQEIQLTGYGEKFEWCDSLASISLKIPERLDTFYKWEHHSCNTASGRMKYRFADKTYPQFAESGWMWTLVDSVYQLNIWHKPIREAPDSVTLKPLTEKDTSNCYYHPQIVWSSKPTRFLFKEFKSINQRSFIISAFIFQHGISSNLEPLFVVAETNLKSRELYFIGECRTKDTTGFIESMYKSFLSIRIKENP